ncbi:hypothetical protein ON010_g4098 [Phytophthora cinnamomi]|nr:hypothetical protein ON010_g4098 [Phytophthora cinnamomi]
MANVEQVALGGTCCDRLVLHLIADVNTPTGGRGFIGAGISALLGSLAWRLGLMAVGLRRIAKHSSGIGVARRLDETQATGGAATKHQIEFDPYGVPNSKLVQVDARLLVLDLNAKAPMQGAILAPRSSVSPLIPAGTVRGF